LTTDLPATARGGAVGPVSARKPRRWLVSVMGGGNLRGRWRAGRRLTAVSLMSGADIDLTHAEIDAPGIRITAIAIMGGVSVVVPAGFDVELTGFAVMGGNDNRVPVQDLPPDAPRVQVRALSLMGGSHVRMKSADRKALEAPTGPPRTDA
jgi:hypothetical protein